MRNRKKRMAMMLAVVFTLMPLPTMLEEQTSQAQMNASSTVAPSSSVPTMYTPVNRAGVAINGVMKTAVDPIKIDGLYYVPFKQIAQVLNYDDIRYHYGKKTYSATDGSVTVRVTIGGTRAMKGDEAINIHAPKYVHGTTYISLDAVSSLFNTFTWFKPENGSIQIQMPARTYKVQAGDSLFKVAQAHHTTVVAVREANGLQSDMLKAGQLLRLPAETQTREMEPSRMSVPLASHSKAVQGGLDSYDSGASDFGTGTPDGSTSPSGMTDSGAGTGTATQDAASTLAKAQAIISTGRQCLGAPYVFGAKPSQAPAKMDCSSFVQYCFAKHGITLPRDSRAQSAAGTQVSAGALKPGDLLFFKYPERYSDGRVGHVGIYMGNGQMIHTVPSSGVTITNYTKSKYWTNNLLFAKRVLH